MSKVAYLDCPTGIAGDMCLGALVDLGVPLAYLTENLDRLGISEEYELDAEIVHRNGQRATKVHVRLKSAHASHGDIHHKHDDIHHKHGDVHHEHDTLRHLPEIEKMIYGANLPPRAETWSLAVFRQLAIAEGAVHGIAPEQVHFHEVGAIDAIVDIVGTCLGLDWLKVDRIVCSALPTGGGTVWAAHGRLPVPVPAVLKLFELKQVPIYSNGIERELVTPTGAAIATTLAAEFNTPPKMSLQQTGLGAGSIDLPIPNILRIWIGTTAANTQSKLSTPETVAVLETQVDDLNPQAIGYLFDALFESGALDVFTQPIGMKKSRPGILITTICVPEKVADCEMTLFRETSTLGIRQTVQQRTVLDRTFDQVETEFGSIQVKVASRNGTIVNVQPEYEDCARIARETHLPWREIHRIALQTWHTATKNSLHPFLSE
ncbi:MAG TPA: nickel pincer cofactor biosynthesis protein LarC [Leptolyngbya sp.]|jgi:uncharacterized protein (TIGR00299 family) protein|nr:nickel pincer cofactor biosynthesis protein LarC [Leptolyngbya sp.]